MKMHRLKGPRQRIILHMYQGQKSNEVQNQTQRACKGCSLSYNKPQKSKLVKMHRNKTYGGVGQCDPSGELCAECVTFSRVSTANLEEGQMRAINTAKS